MNKIYVENFKKGLIGVFPTDTAFGIGCRIDNDSSVRKIFEIKGRPESKPLLALVSSYEMAKQYVDIPHEVKIKLMDKYWPGGLTIILPCIAKNVSSFVVSHSNSLAIRMPDHDSMLDIINDLSLPIVAPSANFSGDKTPVSFEEIDKRFIEKVDFVVPGGCTIKGVSTIIDCTTSEWKILRQGVVVIGQNEL